MIELLFGLTVIFLAYVLYEVYKTVSGADKGSKIVTAPTPPTPVAKPHAAATPPAAVVKTETVAEAEKTAYLRDPATGETSPAPRNYRFAKKWIKEAMVAEGLLSKVYKNSELTGETADKVKAALEKFRTLEKYQA